MLGYRLITTATTIFTCVIPALAISQETTATDAMATSQTMATAQETSPTAPSSAETSTTASAATAEAVTSVTALETTATSNSTTSTQADDSPTSVSLPDGIYYQVIKPGSGPETTTQTMLLHYTLYLTNGEKIESSRDQELPVPLELHLGQGEFITGVETAVKGMRVGEERRMYIPADQAYGATGKGKIKPNTPLMFDMELVGVK